ncbi:MAG TPA: sugar ABC transporter ATP-binding protein [Geminicoccus sp.]|uniref:sugar ABC transporter ATP-binding protein n=1 Tax=Geminicoccus sp. TaxID=2024832 RepID=UPI002E327FD2|nr:sugar ABC transporter ATP-binding protein [Geminicoccus sp.]HEX2525337.1 sugar ABC transporter ATP-binding protein [Geminicoccus sp.]
MNSSNVTPFLRVQGISKRFPGVQALTDVGFDVRAGEAHALLGENGAGKSTLLKILAGAHLPDEGTIELDGRPVEIRRPVDAQALGIVTIYQEFNLLPNLSIAENVFVGREPTRGPFVDWKALNEQARAVTARVGLNMDPRRLVKDLSVAEQQMVEIAKALSMKAKLVIMDEPTSALSETEVERLFRIINDLKSHGIAVVFVTHRLDEVMHICDRLTVLRDGRLVGSSEVKDVRVDDVIRMMVGREVALHGRGGRVAKRDTAMLQVEGLTRMGDTNDPHAVRVRNVSLTAYTGEILGIGGLIGAGRTELARAIFGADPIDAGRILVNGEEVRISTPQDAIRHGIGLVPEDRKQQALFLSLAIRPNLSMTALDAITDRLGFVSGRKERELVDTYRRKLSIRMANGEQLVSNLSGGNQQKVVLARWLALNPRVLIVDEPTRGIDIAAKNEVHHLLFELAAAGIAVIVISSELPELMRLADRIVTMREGQISGEIEREQATEESLMYLFTHTKTAA